MMSLVIKFLLCLIFIIYAIDMRMDNPEGIGLFMSLSACAAFMYSIYLGIDMILKSERKL